MPKRIPILAASDIARGYDCRQVIVVAWDGERTHVVTYGKTEEDCDQAAQGGNRVKDALGWPERLHAEPSRVKKLHEKADRIADIAESLIRQLLPKDEDYEFDEDEALQMCRDDYMLESNLETFQNLTGRKIVDLSRVNEHDESDYPDDYPALDAGEMFS